MADGLGRIWIAGGGRHVGGEEEVVAEKKHRQGAYPPICDDRLGRLISDSPASGEVVVQALIAI